MLGPGGNLSARHAARHALIGVCVALLAVVAFAGRAMAAPHGPEAAGPVPLIIDSDMFSNADDAGAFATAFALQYQGEANVIAIGLNTRTSRPAVATDSWRCAAAITSFYGFPHIPIGTQTPTAEVSGSPYISQCAQLAPPHLRPPQ